VMLLYNVQLDSDIFLRQIPASSIRNFHEDPQIGSAVELDKEEYKVVKIISRDAFNLVDMAGVEIQNVPRSEIVYPISTGDSPKRMNPFGILKLGHGYAEVGETVWVRPCNYTMDSSSRTKRNQSEQPVCICGTVTRVLKKNDRLDNYHLEVKLSFGSQKDVILHVERDCLVNFHNKSKSGTNSKGKSII